jgi:GTP-sensing pleiotropic transcriptional regulator CodY
MENYKNKTGNNNCQNYIQSLKINNTITYNPQEIANDFNDYFSTVADTPIGNIKRDKNDPRVNVNPIT